MESTFGLTGIYQVCTVRMVGLRGRIVWAVVRAWRSTNSAHATLPPSHRRQKFWLASFASPSSLPMSEKVTIKYIKQYFRTLFHWCFSSKEDETKPSSIRYSLACLYVILCIRWRRVQYNRPKKRTIIHAGGKESNYWRWFCKPRGISVLCTFWLTRLWRSGKIHTSYRKIAADFGSKNWSFSSATPFSLPNSSLHPILY